MTLTQILTYSAPLPIYNLYRANVYKPNNINEKYLLPMATYIMNEIKDGRILKTEEEKVIVLDEAIKVGDEKMTNEILSLLGMHLGDLLVLSADLDCLNVVVYILDIIPIDFYGISNGTIRDAMKLKSCNLI